MDSLEEYFEDLQLDVQAAIKANLSQQGNFAHERFVEITADLLQESEVLVDSQLAHVRGSDRQAQSFSIDGFSYELADNSITCFMADYTANTKLEEIPEIEIRTGLRSLANFVRIAADIDEANLLQGSSYDLAQDIYFQLRNATTIRLVLITNRSFPDWISFDDSFEGIDLKPVFVDFWPLERLMSLDKSVHGKEQNEIDLTSWLEEGLPALRVSEADAELETFLTVIPAQILADIYDNLGARVLEGNVRSFLSASGRVNKGIRATLRAEPEKFLAYNNGISATAIGVNHVGDDSIVKLLSIEGLQIVNGGQTTATIHQYSRSEDENQENLESVTVQMKLIVLPPETAAEMVPSISRYANTQNRIQDSDFFSNHSFHARMEGISRRLVCGTLSRESMQSRWYYERSRGSYQAERLRLRSDVERKKFDARFPKNKKISKTDFALYSNCWLQRPQIASRGPQKNFLYFAKEIEDAYATAAGETQFGDEYFIATIGQGLLYQKLKERIQKSDWYESGYLSNIVAYAISKLSFELEKVELTFNWQEIWETQTVSEEILSYLEDLAQRILEVLYSDARSQKNISEWAKSDSMWIEVKRLKVSAPSAISSRLVKFGKAERAAEGYEQLEKGKQLSEVEKYQLLNSVGWDTWNQIKESDYVTVSPKEADLLKLLDKNAVLSDKQMDVLIALLQRSKREGAIRP